VARPALAALAVVQFRLVWNDFLLPMVVMRGDEYMTLPLRLASMGEPGQMAATGLISILLPLALFVAFHKKFMETLAVGMKS
jgi:ABC-type glycerol-3-phosphate transport system permease component